MINSLSTLEHAPADPDQVARHFSHSANTYRQGAQLQLKVGETLLNKRVQSVANITLDLGCGPGLFSTRLNKDSTCFVSLDLSASMLKQNPITENRVQGNGHALPFLGASFDLVYSSLMVQWCDLESVLTEARRILKPGGQILMSTLVTGSLAELQQAWQAVDSDQHIHNYLTFDEVKNKVHQMSWASSDCQLQQETFWFENAVGLAKELKSLGANYVENRGNKGLMTRRKWQKMESAYRTNFYDVKRKAISASYQVVYINLIK